MDGIDTSPCRPRICPKGMVLLLSEWRWVGGGKSCFPSAPVDCGLQAAQDGPGRRCTEVAAAPDRVGVRCVDRGVEETQPAREQDLEAIPVIRVQVDGDLVLVGQVDQEVS